MQEKEEEEAAAAVVVVVVEEEREVQTCRKHTKPYVENFDAST